ncbi:MAG: protein kinase domain-containing protein, partial [Myxococcaceae bacterium]
MPSPQGRDPEIWQRIDALLSEALTLPESERESWLERLSRSDETLASTLREMLSRSETTDSFLRTPVSPEVLAVAGEVASLEEAGTTIGPYRLLRVLGAGGMGQVWLADRIDGTLHREVALKLPRTGWAPGLAERLNQERDALAALEHPHIARLYDAGTTAEGRPYLALEFVEGESLAHLLLGTPLPYLPAARLIETLAGAIHYAHQQGII